MDNTRITISTEYDNTEKDKLLTNDLIETILQSESNIIN